MIDAGTARINRHNPRSGVTQLLVEPISRASADQRKGRAGRTRSGVCFRLYEQQDFDLRPAHTDPELLRVGLAGAILQMKALGLGDIDAFPSSIRRRSAPSTRAIACSKRSERSTAIAPSPTSARSSRASRSIRASAG